MVQDLDSRFAWSTNVSMSESTECLVLSGVCKCGNYYLLKCFVFKNILK